MDAPASLADLRLQTMGLRGHTDEERRAWWGGITGPGCVLRAACRRQIENGDAQAVEWWLGWLQAETSLCFIWEAELRSHQKRMAFGHLKCAQGALECSTGTHECLGSEMLPGLVNATGLPRGLIVDLVASLMPEGQMRAAKDQCSLYVPMIDSETGAGSLMSLVIERLDGGSGILYVHPGLAFIYRDVAFRGAESSARAAVAHLGLWPKASQEDVRWALRSSGARPVSKFAGPSAGGAFALGLAKLMA